MATTDDILKILSNYELLSEREIEQFCHDHRDEFASGDAVRLARLLVDHKRLTEYQSEELMAGRTDRLRLGNYVLLDVLGEGGMGKVYLARHVRMNRKVAVKVLPAEAAASESAVRRFVREMEVAAQLQHPNIVTAFDADESEGVSFLVMEYVRGESLHQLVRRVGPLAVDDAIAYVLQTAHGLAYAHAQGVVHRDIKPANLLLERTGQVKILDMGLARVQWQQRAETYAATQDYLTHSGMVLGTVDFLAPEQARNIKNTDHRADIYSLGCTLYFLLTGRSLYEGKSLMEKIGAHQKGEIPSLCDANSEAPRELDDVFQRMVAKRPEDRFQSMEELIDALGSLAAAGSLPQALRVAAGMPSDRQDTAPETTSASQDDTSRIDASSSASSSVMLSGDSRRSHRMVWLVVVVAAAAMILSSGYVGYRLASRGGGVNNNTAVDVDPRESPLPAAAVKADASSEKSAASGAIPRPVASKTPAGDIDREVAQRILTLGGAVTIVVDFQRRRVNRAEDLPPGPVSISEIKLTSSTFGDADFASVGKLSRLKTLELMGYIDVTDDGLRTLGALTSLRKLVMQNAPITSAGIAHLIDNQDLTSISLDGPQIDDDVIDSLKRFPALTSVLILSPEFSGTRLGELAVLTELKSLVVSGDTLTARTAEALAGFPALAHLAILRTENNDYLQHVAKLSNISTLTLGRSASATAEGISALAAMAGLREVIVYGDKINDEAAVAFGELVQVQRLELQDVRLRTSTVAGIRQALPTCRIVYDGPSLDGPNRRAAEWVLERGGKLKIRLADTRVITVSQTGQLPGSSFRVVEVDLAGVAGLRDADIVRLSELSRLESLNLSRTDISDAALTHCENLWALSTLNVRETAIGDEGLKSVASLSALKDLNLAKTKLTDAGMQHLRSLEMLEVLNLGWVNVSDEGLVLIGGAQRLRHLLLNQTLVTDNVVDWLARHKSLDSLHLGASRFSGSRLEELAALPRLTNLNVQSNIPPEFVVKLGKIPSLLDLGFGGVRDEHLANIASVSQITHLHISSGLSTGKGLRTLGQLDSLRSLTVVNIELNNAHLDALASLGHLEALHLAETGVGPTEVRMLAETLPNCKIHVTPPLEAESVAGAGESNSKADDAATPLTPSIIPRPAEFPGIGRWRVETTFPRGAVNAVDVSPDDRWIACGTFSGNVQIYDAETLEMVEILPGHGKAIGALAWSPDGRQLASGGADGRVRLWNAADRRSRVVVKQTGVVTSVAWSPDGRKLASGGSGHTIHLWSMDGSPKIALPAQYWIAALAWNPDSQLLAVGDGRGKLYLWDAGAPEPVEIDAHEDRIESLAWSPDGQWLVTCGADAKLCFWNTDGTPGPVMVTPDTNVSAVAWSPDGQWLVSGGNGSQMPVRFWQRNGSFGPSHRGHLADILSLDWSRNADWLVSGSGDGSMRFWNLAGPVKEPIVGSGANNLRVAWSPDSQRLVTGGPYKTAHVFNVDGTAALAPESSTLQTRIVDWSADGQRIAVGSHLRVALQLFSADGISVGTIKTSAKHGIAFSPDGRWIAIPRDDGSATLFQPDGDPGPVLNGHTGRVSAVSWSPDSQRLVTGGFDKMLRLWNIDGAEQQVLDAHTPVHCVAWSPDGRRIASGGDTVVQLWDADGNPVIEMTGHDAGITGVAWRPDSQQIVSCAYDGTVRIWDADGTPRQVMRTHTDTPRSVAWSSDGQWIASAGDGTVLLWDALTGEPQWVAILMDHGESATFDAAGKILDGDSEVLDRELVYIVESAPGEIESMKPSEFQQRVAAAEAK